MFYLIAVVLLPIVGFICCILPFRRLIRENLAYLGVLGILVLLFLSPLVIGTNAIVQKDANLLQIPFFMSYRDSIRGFLQLPLWNPYLWSGMPNLAHPLSHVFHPTVFLSLVFPAYRAFNLSLLLAVFFSASFMFLLVRELGQPGGVALVSSVTYAFNEFTLHRLGSSTGPGVEYLYSYSAVPLSLALLLRAVKTRRHRCLHTILFGLSLAFVMNGNPNQLYYCILLCGVLLAYAIIARPSDGDVGFKIGVLPIGLVVLSLVNAVELIPYLEFQQISAGRRLHIDLSGWRMQGIRWSQLPGLFLPHTESLHFGYGSRVGWVALILAVLSLLRLRRGEERRIIIPMLLVLVFGVLLLTHSPLFALLWRWMPFFSRISMIPAVFVFFAIPLSILAGIGSTILPHKSAAQILIPLLIFVEVLAASKGAFEGTRFHPIRFFDYAEELGDYPHLVALNEERTLKPYRIECRSFKPYWMLCQDYAVMYYRLRLVDGEKYLFPTEQVQALLEKEERLRLLDVKYILAPEEVEEPGFALKEKVRWETFDEHEEAGLLKHMEESTEEREWDGTVYVYEAANATHAFLVDDGFTGEVPPETPEGFDVTRFSPTTIELEGYASRPGILFVSEPYYPGWKATVDGVQADVEEVGGGFIGVSLAEGTHSVTLHYDPLSFKLGFWITSGTILAVTAATVFGSCGGGVLSHLPRPHSTLLERRP
jgi:hypothetical protein